MKYLFVYCLLFIACCSSAQTKKTIYVADRTVACDKNDCMQIKVKKKDAWKNITDTVIGLNYEEGYEYRAKVVVNTGNNYSLVKLLSKRKTGYNPAIKLQGKKWLLVSMHDNHMTLTVPDTTTFIQLDITNNRLSGHAGCNNLKGDVLAEGRKISFSRLGYTKMKCADENGNIMEKIVQNLLEATNSYLFKGDKLTLTSAKGSDLVFTAR